MRPVYPNAAEHGRRQKRGHTANHQYPNACAQQLDRAIVRHRPYQPWTRFLHHERCCVQRHAASMAYTTTPVTET